MGGKEQIRQKKIAHHAYLHTEAHTEPIWLKLPLKLHSTPMHRASVALHEQGEQNKLQKHRS